MSAGLLSVAGALAVTLGLLVVLVHVLRRVQGGGGPVAHGFPLRLLKRTSLGPKQGVGLLQVGERVLVVSIAEGGARLLTELDPPARAQILSAALPTRPNRAAARVPDFRAELKKLLPLTFLLLVLAANLAAAAPPPSSPAAAPTTLSSSSTLVPRIDVAVGQGENQMRLSGAVGLVVFIGFLTLLPVILLLMTSFTRILIVFHFLRSALGVQSSPPGQLLAAIALMLTAVVMAPVLQHVNQDALQPYLNGRISQTDAYAKGLVPFRQFMLDNTGERELAMFTDLTGVSTEAGSLEQIPTFTLVAAFVTSELRVAFQMGFVIFLPFVVVDLIVASVLMSLGMFMLPPMMVSLPFKLLLFVLADGWDLVIKNLVLSFR
jgi:flagellar biosynthetic protein FliP